MRTRFGRVEEILGRRKRLVGRLDGGAALELVITSCKRATRRKGEEGSQRKATGGCDLSA